KDSLKKMANLFFTESARLMPEIHQAIRNQDSPALRQAANIFKGSAHCFAAGPTVEAALKLELLAQAGDLTGAEGAWDTLENEVKRLLPVLEAFVQDGQEN